MRTHDAWDDELERNETERPVQLASGDFTPLTELLRANENDPAYLVGVLAQVFNQVVVQVSKYPHGTPESVMFDRCGNDLLRLRHRWLAEYPELVAKYEGRL